MATVVLDASALVAALVGRSPEAIALGRRLVTATCHAPHLIDAEVGSALRRLVLRDELPASAAERFLHASTALIDHRHPMTGALAQAAWERRATVTFYDGLYVSLAVALAAPLLTADARLCRAPGLGCATEQVGVI